MRVEALLWQTGYLTIAKEEFLSGTYFYRLRYPNKEVYQSLNEALLKAWTAAGSETVRARRSLHTLLLANDFTGLEQLFSAFYASIPHDWYRNNPIAQYEGYYASVFYAYFASLGLDLTPEDTSNLGRLDLALRFNGNLYLMEFKVVELVPEGRALEQIKARGYAEKYRAEGLPMHLMGIEFSKEKRALVEFEVETLEHRACARARPGPGYRPPEPMGYFTNSRRTQAPNTPSANPRTPNFKRTRRNPGRTTPNFNHASNLP
jgi:Protein of unknown function (DUF1703).